MKYFFPFLFILIAKGSSAQSLTPEVISSSGDYFTSTAGKLSWTLGEPVIETWSSTTNTLTQGFHQNELTINEVDELNMDIQVCVYPNPTAGTIRIEIQSSRYLSARLYNGSGTLMHVTSLAGLSAEMDLGKYPPGAYVLQIEGSEQIKTFTIIKK